MILTISLVCLETVNRRTNRTALDLVCFAPANRRTDCVTVCLACFEPADHRAERIALDLACLELDYRSRSLSPCPLILWSRRTDYDNPMSHSLSVEPPSRARRHNRPDHRTDHAAVASAPAAALSELPPTSPTSRATHCPERISPFEHANVVPCPFEHANIVPCTLEHTNVVPCTLEHVAPRANPH